ncbi:MAG TPA: glycosyltransferase, partial [Bryobacteraceae bacterium]
MLFYLPKASLLGPHFDRYAILAFWACVAVIAYTYAGYPLMLWMLTKLRRPRPSEPSTEPSITILICAHDEARNIGKKLTGCLALNYPHDRLQIVVVSDGSTDETVQ